MQRASRSPVAFAYLSPALVVMALCGLLPLGIVAFYSLHDTFAGNSFIWVGLDWYRATLTSPPFYSALARSLLFSVLVLCVQIPLGIYLALRLPTQGLRSRIYVVLMVIPLLTPALVVGYLWKVMSLPKVGLLPGLASWLGINYDMNNPVVVWLTLLLMDCWHWISLVVLLCFAGLRAIPEDYYKAARIDGARPWAVFKHIQLPKLRLVLLVAILLRFMDSFMMYTEAYVVSRGGPGVATTFLSHALIQTATIQFDLGIGGAMAMIYFSLIAVTAAFLFSKIMKFTEA